MHWIDLVNLDILMILVILVNLAILLFGESGGYGVSG